MRCAVALLAFVTLQRLGELIWGLRTPGACSPLSEVLRTSYELDRIEANPRFRPEVNSGRLPRTD